MGSSMTVYGVWSRGLRRGSAPSDKGGFRARMLRSSGANLEKSHRLADELRKLPLRPALE